MTDESTLKLLNRLVGSWTTEGTHPAVPGVVVHGTATMEWLEGERFLIIRSRTDNPQFPDGVSIVGFTDRDREDEAARDVDGSQLTMHYFDSRGVFRVYQAAIDDASWRWWRDVPGFSQRFTGTFTDGGNTIAGRSQLCRDDVNWNDDLQITYRRSG